MKNRFERILVGLDLSGADKNILQATAALIPALGTKTVYFFHVMPDFSMPADVEVEFHKLFAPEYPVDEKVRDKIAADVAEYFGEAPGVTLHIEVVEGRPFQKLMHWIAVKDIDLLVVGQKQQREGSGIVARRVARQSSCNVLFVPADTQPDIGKILVPVDFSEASANALRVGITLAAAHKKPALQALYVVDMPPADYYMRSFDSDGFREVLRQSAKTAFTNFVKAQEFNRNAFQEAILDNQYGNVALHIVEHADKIGAGLIVIGAQGHSALENFIFGSVTEKVLAHQANKAVLVVR
jgi:nucleotide-binding universal stress UspA family protein